MRTWPSVLLLCGLALSGCAGRKASVSPAAAPPRAGTPAAPAGVSATNPALIVTPENAYLGKVVWVNAPGRFVVLNFPLGKMAAPEQRLSLYRRGLKVGEVKVTGPQREDNIVADLAAGEAEVGDEARSQ
ncbi:MAG: hypothetical protein ABSD29_04635 [Verrucomicrobiota bacterium]|jgi:hypothetical protein